MACPCVTAPPGRDFTPSEPISKIVPRVRSTSPLAAHKYLRGPRVLYRDDGTATSKQTLTTWMVAAQRRSGLKLTGNKHILTHTFCSHLALRGATTLAIKELAGHRSIRTTMRYMHLSRDHKEQAIDRLDLARGGILGDIPEPEAPATDRCAVGDEPPTAETPKAPRGELGAFLPGDEPGFVTLPGFEPGFEP